eukprot:TRINITY_DN11424_c0_g3_i1.p1 TRINITY_DN11424_c0_g3~~TRINITY_DN11424_c0_g3_i1.p1  ORF type:complete len:858 (+),score=91.48 TRINITY_DN11424_c0_g3_i1:27-2576(+)
MAPYRLWLHAVHDVKEGVLPLRIAEVANAETVSERLAQMIETTNCVGTLDCLKLISTTSLMEVFVTVGGLYALNKSGERCLWLPLPSAAIVHCEHAHLSSLAEFEGAAGLVAYASPVASHAFSWGNMGLNCQTPQPAADADHVWVFVVTSAADSPFSFEPPNLEHTLQLAMEDLSAQGAIRGDVLGLTSSNTHFGEGSFGSVRMLIREDPNRSSDMGDDSPSLHFRRNRRYSESSAEDTFRAIAAKVLTVEVSDENACMETAYLLAAQGHPNVVRFFGLFCLSCGMDQPTYVLMMEAHDGGCLHDRISSDGPLAALDALQNLEGLFQALVHIHGVGIVHKDVKPENILMSTDNRAILVDFGIAAHVTQESRLLVKRGSPGYIAPELFRGIDCGVKADVFSAGVVLYFALSGLNPFTRKDDDATLRANAKAKPRYDRECFQICSRYVMRFLRHLLVANPQRRCTSADAVQTVLLLIETHRVSTGHNESHADDQLVFANASIADAPTVQDMEPEQVVPLEQDSQPDHPTASDRGPSILRQEQLETFSVRLETDGRNDNDVAVSEDVISEAPKTHAHDLSSAGSAVFMHSEPTVVLKDTPNAAQAAKAPAGQSRLELRQADPTEQDSQFVCGASSSSRGSCPLRQEQIEAFSLPGATDKDCSKNAGGSNHESFEAANAHSDCAASLNKYEPETTPSVVRARSPRDLLREYRKKLIAKHGISQPILATEDPRKHDCFDSIALCSPSERSSVQSTRCSSLFNFIRRRSCEEQKGSDQDEPERRGSDQDEPEDGTVISQSGSSIRHQASTAFKAARSAWCMVRTPFKGNRRDVKIAVRSFDSVHSLDTSFTSTDA